MPGRLLSYRPSATVPDSFAASLARVQFHERGEVKQLVLQGGELLTESASHLVHGHPVGSGRSGSNQIGYGLGLAQVHLAIQESPLGVFAGEGRTASALDETTHHLLEDVRRTMARDFRRIFAGVGVGSPKDGHQHFVDDFAFSRMDFPEGEGIGLAFVQRFSTHRGKDSGGDADGFGTRNTYHSDGSTLGGSYGTDGILLVHFFV